MTPLEDARHARGWKRSQLLSALSQAAARRGLRLPERDSLERQIKYFEKGQRRPGELYQELLCQVYGCEPVALGFLDPPRLDDDVPGGPEASDHPGGLNSPDHPDDLGGADDLAELEGRFAAASSLDAALVELFEAQTQNFRMLDRRLGAGRLSAQTQAHVRQMEELLTYSLGNARRPALAAALTEAAALAGWQALDLGRLDEAWNQHEIGKAAAREAGNPAVLAHVTAQQAYVLLDLSKGDEALTLIQQARRHEENRLPALLRSWLLAAEGEARAAVGDEVGCRRALDAAARLLPANPTDPELPFLALNDAHLARWRGHCLARLGAAEAIEDLSHALAVMDKSFARAEAGLRCDLALALRRSGDEQEAAQEARRAAALATTTNSARQRRRIAQLLKVS